MSELYVQEGQSVMAGDQIGLSGHTGCATGPHVHFNTSVFVNGRFVLFDPFGWEGPMPDPWAQVPQGTQSFWLWQPGQAPGPYKERDQAPNTDLTGRTTGNAPVAITFVRWFSAADNQNANNQFVELTLDPRFAPSGSIDLSRFTLFNNHGDTFAFPNGFKIQAGPPVRVYAGAGQNSGTELYWGRTSGVFDPQRDCITLQAPTGAEYRLGLGKRCP